MRWTGGLVQEGVGAHAMGFGGGHMTGHHGRGKGGFADGGCIELTPQVITAVVQRGLGVVILNMTLVIVMVGDTMIVVLPVCGAVVGGDALHMSSRQRTLPRQDEHEQPKDKTSNHDLNHRTSVKT